MKSNIVRLSMLFVLLALTPQMSPAWTSAGNAQNTNSSTMSAEPEHPRHAPSRHCRTRCAREYRMCVRAAGNNPGRRRSCAVRYRNCLRRCDR
jgi:hypothetical protein